MPGALAWAMQTIQRQLGIYAPGSAQQAIERIRVAPDLDAASACDILIEAVPEKLELKRKLFSKLDKICAPHAVFATNTSGLSINAIAEAVTRRDRFGGAHFFTPTDVIPLAEVICNDETSAQSIDIVMSALRYVGKRPVLVRKDISGFIANRIQHALAREAISLLEQRDMNGIDVHHAIANYLYKDLENRTESSELLTQKVTDDQYGVKSGQGFYPWSPERREHVLHQKSQPLGELTAWLATKDKS